MKRLWRFGRFGAFYGAGVGVALAVIVAAYVALATLLNWPKDGTVTWFLTVSFSILLGTAIGFYILGSISGFVFGLLGSLFKSPVGWSLSGVSSGFMAFCMLLWILWMGGRIRHPAPRPPFFALFTTQLWLSLFPCAALGMIGWLVGVALCTGLPHLPRLDQIRDQREAHSVEIEATDDHGGYSVVE